MLISWLFNTPMSSEVLNVKEAAKLLHVHEETARELARTGKVPAAKMGRAWIFVKQDLLDTIRSRYTLQDDRCRVSKKGDSRWLLNDTRSGIRTSALTDAAYADLLKPQ